MNFQHPSNLNKFKFTDLENKSDTSIFKLMHLSFCHFFILHFRELRLWILTEIIADWIIWIRPVKIKQFVQNIVHLSLKYSNFFFEKSQTEIFYCLYMYLDFLTYCSYLYMFFILTSVTVSKFTFKHFKNISFDIYVIIILNSPFKLITTILYAIN